ncbi:MULTISPECIES: hypothetical protein [Atopobium]|uniref:Uncharacterized protein n=1 Tax=Atopobium minutum 10063974 TaxID=997872 RepID=N2BVR0_9ACTN|nr:MULTISPECIES: hypothetical protein [Atopobium]EMZ42683.1 hypothetical protein HMPREF1091_00241 [Atopobium minutum 10063974]ERL15248.1 hypothetical protein HMPREF1247_0812 [Atopobium sp. BV3Ac4]
MLHIELSDRVKAVIFVVLFLIVFGIVGRMDCEDYALTHKQVPAQELHL